MRLFGYYSLFDRLFTINKFLLVPVCSNFQCTMFLSFLEVGLLLLLVPTSEYKYKVFLLHTQVKFLHLAYFFTYFAYFKHFFYF